MAKGGKLNCVFVGSLPSGFKLKNTQVDAAPMPDWGASVNWAKVACPGRPVLNRRSNNCLAQQCDKCAVGLNLTQSHHRAEPARVRKLSNTSNGAGKSDKSFSKAMCCQTARPAQRSFGDRATGAGSDLCVQEGAGPRLFGARLQTQSAAAWIFRFNNRAGFAITPGSYLWWHVACFFSSAQEVKNRKRKMKSPSRKRARGCM